MKTLLTAHVSKKGLLRNSFISMADKIRKKMKIRLHNSQCQIWKIQRLLFRITGPFTLGAIIARKSLSEMLAIKVRSSIKEECREASMVKLDTWPLRSIELTLVNGHHRGKRKMRSKLVAWMIGHSLIEHNSSSQELFLLAQEVSNSQEIATESEWWQAPIISNTLEIMKIKMVTTILTFKCRPLMLVQVLL